jgi:hypothetical protein
VAVKEKQSFKRFDLFSILAGLSVLLMFVFEGFFIFELYEAQGFQSVRTELPAEEVAPVGDAAPPVEDLAPSEPVDVTPVG